MKQKLILHQEFQMFYRQDGIAFCDSLQIAETFEKQHGHVLRDIEKITQSKFGASEKINKAKLEEIAEFTALNFELSGYKDASGKKNKKYLLTRDGFTLVVMGYEGEKALAYKIAYINRFNQMKAFIESLELTKIEFPMFTEAILLANEQPKQYHFSNEINMIYRIVLGMDAKKFRMVNGLQEKEVIKPHLSLRQIKAVENLQRIDIGLLEAGLSYDERKERLTAGYAKRLKLAG